MKLLRDYGLSVVLLIFFLSSLIGQGIFQWVEFSNESREHKHSPKVEEFVPAFISRALENWQSEFLQLLTFVVLTSVLSHKGSPESKDSDEETKMMLTRIDRKLNALAK